MSLNATDKLDQIFELQRALNKRIGAFPDLVSDSDRPAWVLAHARAMSQEIAELTDSVSWKWWAKYQKYDEANVLVELVDILHFLVSTCLVLGVSPDELFELYRQKNLVNIARQESGYTTKDESDNLTVRLIGSPPQHETSAE